jgi:hypothetical protein
LGLAKLYTTGSNTLDLAKNAPTHRTIVVPRQRSMRRIVFEERFGMWLGLIAQAEL